MDTYKNIHFEVVQIGDILTIRVSIPRRSIWGKVKTEHRYAGYSGSSLTDSASLTFNFKNTLTRTWGLSSLDELRELADRCHKRYCEVGNLPQTVLYSTKATDNFDKINELTLQLIEASKVGDDAKEKIILKQLEALHEKN